MIRNPHIELLRTLLVKFGLLSREQVFPLISGRLKRRQTYHYLRTLVDAGEVYECRRESIGQTLWVAMQKLIARATGLDEKNVPPIPVRQDQLAHRLGCNDVLLALAQRSAVSGITTEDELIRYSRENPIGDRRPDGIARISHPDTKPYELAVELELGKKRPARVEQVLDDYAHSFEEGSSSCIGLILVTPAPFVASMYENALKKRSEAFRARVLNSTRTDLADISERALGTAFAHLCENPGKPCTQIRTGCGKSVVYRPYRDLGDTYKDSSLRRNNRKVCHAEVA